MQLKSVKTAADLPFSGVEIVKIDKAITEVVIGGKLRIRAPNTYSNELQLLVEAPFEAVTRHRVTATIDGFDPKVSHHESEYEAKREAEDFEAKGAKVSRQQVSVLVNDAGEVVGDADEAGPNPVANDELVPF